MSLTGIQSYNALQAPEDTIICDILMSQINTQLPQTTSKVWHGHPVWFLEDNPLVGYNRQKSGIALLFRSGQSFDEAKLKPLGKFKAAQIHYTHSKDIDLSDITRRLDQSQKIQRDYKNIVKRKGVLEKLS